jgi:hypothetical protein
MSRQKPVNSCFCLTLALFVLFVGTNDKKNPLAPDDFAVPANFFNRCLHFHFISPKLPDW